MPAPSLRAIGSVCLLLLLAVCACRSTLGKDLGAPDPRPAPAADDDGGDDDAPNPDDDGAPADDDGDPSDDDGSSDADGGTFVPEADAGTPTEAPQLVKTIPQNGSRDVELAPLLTLVFDRPIVAGPGVLQLVETDGAVIEQTPFDDPRVTIDGKRALVDLATTLAPATAYHVLIGAGAVTDSEGIAFEGLTEPTAFGFVTRAPAADAPSLLATDPATGSTGVPVGTDLVLSFDREVVAGADGELVVHEANSGDVAGAVALADEALVSFSGDLVTVDLPVELAFGSVYFVTVDPGAIRAASGGEFPGFDDGTTFRFITETATGLELSATVPESGATAVPLDVTFTMGFSRAVVAGSGFITLFGAEGGEPVASIDVTSDAVAIDGAAALLDFGASLEGAHSYYVTVNPGAFVSVDGTPFAGLTGTGGWAFTTESSFATDPEHGATGVEPATDLLLTFGETLTLGTGNVIVMAGGAPLETIPMDDPRVAVADGTVTVDLDALLAGNTQYDVVVESGALELGGSAFERFAEPGSWSFTTAPVVTPGDVAESLVLWLDASHAESLRLDGGVRYWADRSPEHNDLVQLETEARPAVVQAALGDAAVVRFDGEDDSLVAASGFTFGAFEGFLVWQSRGTPATTAKHSILINGKHFEVNHGHPSSSARNALSSCFGSSCDDDQGWQNVRFAPNPDAEIATLWDFGFDATTTSTFARAQGSAAVTNLTPTQAPTEALTPFSVGGAPVECSNHDGCYFEGDVAEVLLYSRVLSPEQRLAVTAALRDKWGLPAPSCGEDESLGPSGSCLFVLSGTATATAARSSCQDRGRGWDLASIRSAADQAFVETLIESAVWLGGSDGSSEGTWRWLNDTFEFWTGDASGSAVGGSFTAWSADEPSAGSAEDCLFLAPGLGWGDEDCTEALAYVCEGPGS